MFKSKFLVIHHRKPLLHALQSLNMNSEVLEYSSPYFLDIIPILNVFPFGRKNLQVLGFFFSVPIPTYMSLKISSENDRYGEYHIYWRP